MILARLTQQALALRVLHHSGALPGLAVVRTISRIRRQYGPAGTARSFAVRFGDKTALIDQAGALTYHELADQIDRWTNSLRCELPDPQQRTVALMCRNNRYVVLGLFGALGAGARLVFLNTDLGPRQLAAVCERERIDLIVHDQEFGATLDAAEVSCSRVIAGITDAPVDADTMDARIAAASPAPPPRPSRPPTVVILTSGSSGTPKGAPREGGSSNQLLLLAGFLQKIPLRGDDRIYIAPPAFHGWGLIVLISGLTLGATVVLSGKFDAEATIRTLSSQRCSVFVAVPTMLQRIMSLPDSTLASLPSRQLRIIGSGGARLDPRLFATIARRFGPVIHNLYGATEASYITIATPEDLAADPACAGRPPLGVQLAIMHDGRPAPAGQAGDIYVRTHSQISRYTDGGTRPTHRGMVRTGDIGRLDDQGRLVVVGRADGMIVSGGENVFPEEVELVLAQHPAISDAKVVPVDDPDFGQRFVAIVVPADPARPPDLDALNDHIATMLARSRVPRRYVVVPEIPRTASGKVSRATLDNLLDETAQPPTQRQ